MSLSSLPLSYCTNVHPGRTLDEVCLGLREYTAPTRDRFGSPLAAGLWLANSVIRELKDEPDRVQRLIDELSALDLVCYTLNTFPYGDFHSDRVKEKVYVPDWSTNERLNYTIDCAEVLAQLMPEGTEGSLSTVPLGFKQLPHDESFLDQCVSNLLHVADSLDVLHDETGRVIRLAIEPEPLCILETTDEAITFFEQLRSSARTHGLEDVVQRHIGLCYDVCHQSVEFEDVAESIRRLHAADIRINKVHITCALRLEDPATNGEAREVLSHFVEPRYLHQLFAKTKTGEILAAVDLSKPLALDPPDNYLNAEEWRVHFHVPVNAESLGPLLTTRDDLKRALTAIADLNYAPHLEVETYTWVVLPGESQPPLVDGLTEELNATRSLLDDICSK
ncbi:MAG: metabolite traffic protein EboE [Planctomycetaceae bacterium]|nr:metabolite traffic protein EboE [Planctomycetaceae bacterium]